MTSVAASFFASLSVPASGPAPVGGGSIGQPANDAFGAMLKASPPAVAAPSAVPVDAGLQGAMIATLLASTPDAFTPPALTPPASTPPAVTPPALTAPTPAVALSVPLDAQPIVGGSPPIAALVVPPPLSGTPASTASEPVIANEAGTPAPTPTGPAQASNPKPRETTALPVAAAAPAPTPAAPRDAAPVRSSPTLETKDRPQLPREYGLVRPTHLLPAAQPIEAAVTPVAAPPARAAEPASAFQSPATAPVELADAEPVQTATLQPVPTTVQTATLQPVPTTAPALPGIIAQVKPAQSSRAEEVLEQPVPQDAPAPAANAPAIATPPAPAPADIVAGAEPEPAEPRNTELAVAPAAQPAPVVPMLLAAQPPLLAAQPVAIAAVVQPHRATPEPAAGEPEPVDGQDALAPDEPRARPLAPDPVLAVVPVQQPEAIVQPAVTPTARPDRDGAPTPSVRAAQPAAVPPLAPADPLTPADDRGQAPAARGDEPPALRAAAAPADRVPAPATPRDAAPQFTLPAAPAPTVAAPPTQPSAPATITAQPGRMGQELGVTIAHHVASGGATGGGETITLRLNPVDMGQIDVKLSFDDGGTLRAVVSADNPAALEMLRRDSADLGRALADAGVRADTQTLRFDTRAGTGQSGGDSRPGDQHAPRQPEPRAGIAADTPDDITPVYRPLRTRGGVDMVA